MSTEPFMHEPSTSIQWKGQNHFNSSHYLSSTMIEAAEALMDSPKYSFMLLLLAYQITKIRSNSS